MDRWFSLVLQFSCDQSIATHTHTHTLMTPIQMACLLCVYWPALKGIFHLLFFPEKGICPVSTAVYLQISLAHVPINPKLRPQLSASVFTVFSDISAIQSQIFGSILKAAPPFLLPFPIFQWMIVPITIRTVPVTNCNSRVFLFLLHQSFFLFI